MSIFKDQRKAHKVQDFLAKTSLGRFIIRVRLSLPDALKNNHADIPGRLQMFNTHSEWLLSTFFESLQDEHSRNVLRDYLNCCKNGTLANPNIRDPDQYRIPELKLGKSGQEYVADCGAFEGDTLLDLLKNTNILSGGGGEVFYAFETDPEQLKTLYKVINENGLGEKVCVFPHAVWHEATTLCFSHDDSNPGSSRIAHDGVQKINAFKLDDLLTDRPVTLIKMDIEGAELNALKGGSNIIVTQKPKLAISIYHKPDDLWQIPQYISSLVPEYRYWIRWHGIFYDDLVLYATTE